MCLGFWSKGAYQSYEVDDKVKEFSLQRRNTLENNRVNEIYGNTVASLIITRAILIQVSP